MSFYIYCTNCGQKLEGEDEHLGNVAPCPACNKEIMISENQIIEGPNYLRIKTPNEEIDNLKKKTYVILLKIKTSILVFTKIGILQTKKIKIVVSELESLYIEIGSHVFHHPENDDNFRISHNKIDKIISRIHSLQKGGIKGDKSNTNTQKGNNIIRSIKILYYKTSYWLELRSLGKNALVNINEINCNEQLKARAINAADKIQLISDEENSLKNGKNRILQNPLATVFLLVTLLCFYNLTDWRRNYDEIIYKIDDLIGYTKKITGLNLSPETSKLLSKAKHGDLSAQFDLAERYMSGLGVDKDIDEGFKWLNKSAKGGLPMAEVALGFMYIKGETPSGVVDKQTGLNWITKAAEHGDPRSQATLGTMYLKGLGVDTNKKTGLYWLSEASKGGDKAASEILDNEYPNIQEHAHKGLDEKKYNEDISALLERSEKGDAVAQHQLAEYYWNGKEPFKQDWEIAENLETKSADQKNPDAELTLGLFKLLLAEQEYERTGEMHAPNVERLMKEGGHLLIDSARQGNKKAAKALEEKFHITVPN